LGRPLGRARRRYWIESIAAMADRAGRDGDHRASLALNAVIFREV
jgi:hypothetical protein